MAVARDVAFSFIYAANIDCLRQLGAQVVFFSPLADAALPPCDALWLPGGYPELHGDPLAANSALWSGLRAHVAAGKPVLADCGGLMSLLDSIVDKAGVVHAGAGLLPGRALMQARLAALHRRSQGRAQAMVTCGSLRFDSNHPSFWLGDRLLALTPREHAALEALLARAGTPLGKSRLAERVFPLDSTVGPDAIEQVLHRLRQKLQGSDLRIVTVRGLGYMLEAQAA